MLLAFTAGGVAIVAVAADAIAPRMRQRLTDWRRHAQERRHPIPPADDPGRELRAEQRARALLRSCVNTEEWEMYRDLGFIRVLSTQPDSEEGASPCAYLLYPHRPIVAYELRTGRLLGEYCVTFEDPSRPYGSGRLPKADDVLAQWMALTADELGLISRSNMHLPGRQVELGQVENDLRRLAQWERGRRLSAKATAS